jgi:NAD(P)H-hydrate epimerase
VERITRASVPVISLDLPSGIDADTGEAPGVAVRATATMTLALPKPGLFTAIGHEHAGRVHLGDIGLPAVLYRRLGLDAGTPFAAGRIVRLEDEA